MIPRSVTLTVAATLVALSAAIAWETPIVSGYSQAENRQADSNQQRRGKNGAPSSTQGSTSPDGTGTGQADQDSAGSKPASAGAAQSTSQPDDSGAASQADKSNSSGAKQQTGSDSRNSSDDPLGSRTGPQPRQPRPDPPPFDRPPLAARSSRQPDSGRQMERASRTDSGAAANTSGSDSTSQPDPTRGRSDRPDLRRSPDLPPAPAAGSSDRGRPPTLQRPTDDQGSADYDRQQPRAGQASQQSGGKDETIKLASTLVSLPLLVSDRSGRFIPQLSKNDFDVYEDGVRQEIAFFGNEEVPFNIALMLDISPSVSDSLEAIQEAAIGFVRQLRTEDRIMIVAFDRNVRFLTEFTNDRYILERAIQNTRTGNGTSVYEAVYDTVANRLRHVQGRKALILLSDGEDTTSRSVGYDEAINIVTESDVLVYGLRFPDTGGYGPRNGPWGYPRTSTPYPVPRLPFPFPWPHLADPSDPDPSGDPQWGRRSGNRNTNHGRDFLGDVAEAGGGPVYDAKTVRDMPRLARQIADELRHVYVASYYPTNSLSNGGYRSIRVQVRGRDDIAVRHRRGYNADDVRSRSTI